MKILIVDDHALFREGLRLILGRLGAELSVIEAGSAEVGLAVTKTEAMLDLILLDLNLPGLGGSESVRNFRHAAPTCPIIILSGSDDQQAVRDGIEAGAQGFIHKSSTTDEMLNAMRGVLDGKAISRLAPGFLEPAPALTRRQREVLARLCEGVSNKQIARDLDMSENTVRSHLYAIFQVFGVKTRTHAAMFAKSYGLV